MSTAVAAPPANATVIMNIAAAAVIAVAVGAAGATAVAGPNIGFASVVPLAKTPAYAAHYSCR
ncbi:MAG: hypothetical protein LBC38_02960 [Oscillospiraceae bacterium]|nr:hypothetical protein [Oscillospiraceae bacterium]